MSFIIVDAYGFLFRAYHSLPPLTNSEGQNVGAIYGMINMLLKALNEHKPSHVLVALDSGRKTFRSDIFPEYKSHRPDAPQELINQMHLLTELLVAMNLTHLAVVGFEADDIIASAASQLSKSNTDTVIIGSDKDMLPLMELPHIKIFDPMKAKFIGPDDVVAKYGVTPQQMTDYLAIVGDSSDFVPGVKGVGSKTAAHLLQQFDSLDGIYANLTKLTGRQRKLMEESREDAYLSQKLIQLHLGLEVVDDLEKFKFTQDFPASFTEFLQRQGFHSILKKLNLQIAPQTKIHGQIKDGTLRNINSELIQHIISEGKCALYWQDEYLHIAAGTLAYRLLIKSRDMFVESVKLTDILGQLAPIFDGSVQIITLNSRGLYKALEAMGITLSNFDDLQVMSYLLNCGRFDHAGPNVLTHLGFESFDAISALEAYALLHRELFAAKALSFYLEVDRKIPSVVYQMETKGVYIDLSVLEALSADFSDSLKRIERQIFDVSGEEFNIASPLQLGEILFNKLKLPAPQKAKSGALSTKQSILEDLAEQGFVIASLILQWRHFAKLLNTYTRALPQYISAQDGRVHCKFMLTMTSTGRFSSVDPNLQNIPIRTEEGMKIRRAFAKTPGHVILALDYSQIELRLLAHIADIKVMQDTLRNNQDIHAMTASEIFGADVDVKNPEVRRQAKAINFGIIYGISAFGLANRLDISRADAQNYIDKYFEKFPGIKDYMDKTIEFARIHGYVETLFGRRCYVNDINSKNYTLRSFAERAAINAPLQGTAADLMKKAMVNLPAVFAQYLILQIHDELLFEVPEGLADEAAKAITKAMESVVNFRVPVTVTVKKGDNWLDAV